MVADCSGFQRGVSRGLSDATERNEEEMRKLRHLGLWGRWKRGLFVIRGFRGQREQIEMTRAWAANLKTDPKDNLTEFHGSRPSPAASRERDRGCIVGETGNVSETRGEESDASHECMVTVSAVVTRDMSSDAVTRVDVVLAKKGSLAGEPEYLFTACPWVSYEGLAC
jgi:hypothetical protein